MKRFILFTVLILMFSIAVYPSKLEFTFGGGFNTYKLRDLRDNYEYANNDWEAEEDVQVDYFNENMSGKSYLYEIHYRFSPKLRVGIGYSRMLYKNHAEHEYYSVLYEVDVYQEYNDKIKYNLFYLSAKYNVHRALYAGLRIGWGTAGFNDNISQYFDQTYIPLGHSHQEFNTNGFLFSPSVGTELKVWKCFNIGVEAGYRYLDMNDVDHFYPNQILWFDGWEGAWIDLDSSGFFLNLFVIFKI